MLTWRIAYMAEAIEMTKMPGASQNRSAYTHTVYLQRASSSDIRDSVLTRWCSKSCSRPENVLTFSSKSSITPYSGRAESLGIDETTFCVILVAVAFLCDGPCIADFWSVFVEVPLI